MKKKALCILLALVLCVGVLSVASLATEAPSPTELSEPSESTGEAVVSDEPDVGDELDETGDADETDGENPAAADGTEAVSLGLFDGESETTTITVGQTVTDAAEAVYSIELENDVLYYLDAAPSVEVVIASPEGGGSATGGNGTTVNGGGCYALHANEAKTCTLTVTAGGSFTLKTGASAATALSADTTVSTTLAAGASALYSLTASQEETYYYGCSGCGLSYYNSEGKGEDVLGLHLDAGKTTYVLIQNWSDEEEKTVSFCLHSESAIPSWTMDTGTINTTETLFKVTFPAGCYVFETTSSSGNIMPSGGYDMDVFQHLDDYYSLCDDGLFVPEDRTLVFYLGAGTHTLRSVVESDYTVGEFATTYSTSGLYCFVAEAGDYRLTTAGTNTEATVYSAAGKTLATVEGNDCVLFSVSAGQKLYVSCSGHEPSFQLEKVMAKTITLGTEISLTGTYERYTYTAAEDGYLCIYAPQAIQLYKPSALSDWADYGWASHEMEQAASYESSLTGYGFIPVKKGVALVLDLCAESGDSATVTFGTETSLFANNALTVGADGTTLSADEGTWKRFTPTADGYYAISVSTTGSSGTAEGAGGPPPAGGGEQVTMSVSGKTEKIWHAGDEERLYLKAGQGYVFSLAKGMKMTIAPVTKKTLALDTETAVNIGEMWTYTATEKGIYELTMDGVLVDRYINGSPGTIGANSKAIRVLQANETLDMQVSAAERGETSGGKLTLRKLSLTDLTALELNKEYKEADGALAATTPYAFSPNAQGLYVLYGWANIYGAGSCSEWISDPYAEGTLFWLDANEGAIIGFYDFVVNDIQITTAASLQTTTLPLGVKTTLTCGDYYCFTAPADGTYVLSVAQEGRPENAREAIVCAIDGKAQGHDVLRILQKPEGWDEQYTPWSCELKKGESVYVLGTVFTDSGISALMSVGQHTCQWDSGVVTKEATTTAEGEKTYTCSVCGDTKIETIAAITVVNQLKDIAADIDEDAEADDIREAVQDIGAETLTEALSGGAAEAVIEQLEQLEEELDGSVTIVVTDDAQESGVSSSVTIVGAKLNNLAEEGSNITLTIDVAPEEKTLPSGVSEENAIHLTIDLEGVENPHELAVPVCLTIAIPETMDPQKVCLVHYVTGKTQPEILTPVVYQEADGTWYARFVIGGFSHFVLAERETVVANVARAPKTGDEAALSLWLALLAVGALAATVLAKKKAK